MSPVNRVFLAAEAGQPMSAVAAEAYSHAAASGWADPGLRAHEGRRSRTIAEASATSIAVSLGAPGAAVHYYPNLDMAIQAALSSLGEPPVLLSRVERRSALTWAAERSSPAEPLLCRVDGNGIIDLGHWQELLGQRPGLALLQVANQETGSLQPLVAAAAACEMAGVPLVVEASTSVGRVPLPACSWLGLVADARSWAGGTPSLLVVRPGTGHRATRPGMGPAVGEPGQVNVAGVAAAALGLEGTLVDLPATAARHHAWTTRMRAEIPHRVPDVAMHGSATDHLPYLVALSALYVDGEALLLELDRRGFAVASGSPCANDNGEMSHVLSAIGALGSGNVRVSLPLDTTEQDIDRFLDELPDAVRSVRVAGGAADL